MRSEAEIRERLESAKRSYEIRRSKLAKDLMIDRQSELVRARRAEAFEVLFLLANELDMLEWVLGVSDGN